jgi:predicted nucleotidyltransferase
MEKLLNELVSRLRGAYGDDLLSVVLYGSAATGEYHEKFSDLNVLCVLKSIGVRELEKGEEAVGWWLKQKQPLPLFLSREEVENSHDAFPIEFLDIQQNHRILHGEDVVANIEVKTQQHRRQVEHEMRSGLLRLRERYLGLQRDKKEVARLMLDSLPTFSTLFRHALILGGAAAPAKKREIFRATAERFSISAQPFITLLETREGKRKLGDEEIKPLFEAYLTEITRMAEVVDKL